MALAQGTPRSSTVLGRDRKKLPALVIQLPSQLPVQDTHSLLLTSRLEPGRKLTCSWSPRSLCRQPL